MKASKLTSAGLAALLMAALFSGCGSSGEGDTIASSGNGNTAASTADAAKTDNTAGEKVVLEVVTHRTDRVDDGTLDKITEDFEKVHGCDVQYVAYQDYTGTIATRMGTDDYGDVLMIPDDVELKDLSNFFVPLGTYDELSKKYRWTDSKMDAEKNVYGLAYGGNATGVLYNKKIWSSAGITELPKTPDEFIADLKLIAEKTDAIPYYTQYKDASWTITQWQSLVLSATGDPDYENKILRDKLDLFDEKGGYYPVYKLMFDIFSTPEVIEEDHMTTEWESSKVWMGEGKIGTMVMGSWAISQFQALAEDPSDIGYMPVPITAPDGKQYAETTGDYCVGVNKHSDHVDLAKEYVEWFVKDSGFAASEGMIPTSVTSDLPDNLAAFSGAEFFSKNTTPDDLLGKFNEIDNKSGVGVSSGDTDNFKIKLAEAAFAGKGEEEFKSILAAENEKWAKARDEVLG